MQHIVTANDLRPGIRKQWECVAAPLRLSPVKLRWIDANPDDSNTSCIEFPKLLLKTPQLGVAKRSPKSAIENHRDRLRSRLSPEQIADRAYEPDPDGAVPLSLHGDFAGDIRKIHR